MVRQGWATPAQVSQHPLATGGRGSPHSFPAGEDVGIDREHLFDGEGNIGVDAGAKDDRLAARETQRLPVSEGNRRRAGKDPRRRAGKALGRRAGWRS